MARLLALFDLDGFKHYNDTFGHPAGDALLCRLGANLEAFLGARGQAFRMGGDEFCALFHDGRLGRGGGHDLVERARQRATVAEPRPGVRHRLAARGVEHRDVLAEGQRQPDPDEHERSRRQADRERVELAQRAVHEQFEADRARDQRSGDPAQVVVGAATLVSRRRLPGGDRDHEQSDPPAGVEPAAGLIGARRGAHEVHRVGEPEQQDAAREQGPGAAQPPARAGQRAGRRRRSGSDR